MSERPTLSRALASPEPGQAAGDARVPGAAWRLLALLTAVNVLSFADRQLLAAVAPLVMDELRLTRTELGLLVGFAFVALFSLAGLALGTLADRVARTRLVAAGLVVWSAATAGSGLAQAWEHLALARLLVGIGEAALLPAGVSLLADAWPPARLGVAAAVFTSGAPVGQALSYAAAAALAPHLGWRGCFLLMGALGIVFVVPLLVVGEPRRAGAPGPSGRIRGAGLAEVARTLVSVPAAGLTVLGIVAFAFVTGAALHTIAWLVQERGFTPSRAAALAALITAGAGGCGNLLVGAAADRREARAPGGRARVLASLAPIVAVGSFVFYTAPPRSAAFHLAWAVATGGMLGWLGAALAAYERLVPPALRGTAVAFAILCLNVLGIGPGALLAGWVGDTVSLTRALQLSAGVALLAAPAFAVAASRYAADQQRARAAGRPT